MHCNSVAEEMSAEKLIPPSIVAMCSVRLSGPAGQVKTPVATCEFASGVDTLGIEDIMLFGFLPIGAELDDFGVNVADVDAAAGSHLKSRRKIDRIAWLRLLGGSDSGKYRQGQHGRDQR